MIMLICSFFFANYVELHLVQLWVVLSVWASVQCVAFLAVAG
jgi:hypothetical protein